MISLAALADPTRRRIFERLHRRPHTVGEVAKRARISQPAASQHLAVLRRARLVRVRRDGARRIYRARPAGLAPLRRWVAAYWGEARRAGGRPTPPAPRQGAPLG